jgi:hypothetical protein
VTIDKSFGKQRQVASNIRVVLTCFQAHTGAMETNEAAFRRIVREEVEAVFARQPQPVRVARDLPMIRL